MVANTKKKIRIPCTEEARQNEKLLNRLYKLIQTCEQLFVCWLLNVPATG